MLRFLERGHRQVFDELAIQPAVQEYVGPGDGLGDPARDVEVGVFLVAVQQLEPALAPPASIRHRSAGPTGPAASESTTILPPCCTSAGLSPILPPAHRAKPPDHRRIPHRRPRSRRGSWGETSSARRARPSPARRPRFLARLPPRRSHGRRRAPRHEAAYPAASSLRVIPRDSTGPSFPAVGRRRPEGGYDVPPASRCWSGPEKERSRARSNPESGRIRCGQPEPPGRHR